MKHSFTFSVRPMTVQDVSDVLAIERAVQSHPWTEQQISDAVSSYQCTVMLAQHKVVGFCIIQQVLDEASLLLIAIEPSHQGQGLGKQLLNESLQRLSPQPLQIFLEVRQSNQPAIALYESLYFHQIDVRKNYYPSHDGLREDAVIMAKSNAEDFHQLFSSQSK